MHVRKCFEVKLLCYDALFEYVTKWHIYGATGHRGLLHNCSFLHHLLQDNPLIFKAHTVTTRPTLSLRGLLRAPLPSDQLLQRLILKLIAADEAH